MKLITSHIGSDFDSLASMVAASKLYDGAVMSFSGSACRTVREFLKRFPGRWEVLTPRKIHLEDVELLVVVDARSRGRIGPFSKLLDRSDVKVHLYDHHPPSRDEIPAEKRIIEPVGAVTSLMVEILLREGIPISPQEATLYAMGIYEDTGALTFGPTCRRDYDAIAKLKELGADMTLLSVHVELSMSSAEKHLQDELVEKSWQRYINGAKVILSVLECPHYIEGLSLFVHRLRDYFDADVALAAVSMEKRTYVVARSKEGILDVARFLTPLGGGGHPQASSLTLTQVSPQEIINDLEKALWRAIKPAVTVRAIMTSPVMALDSDVSVDEAYRVMIRYGHAALPITAGGKILGIITRKDLDKAQLHGLGTVMVSEYMTEGVITISPKASVAEAHRLMVSHNIGRLPVIDGETLQGIVTRTDLLRALYPISLPEEERIVMPPLPWEEDVSLLMKKRLTHWVNDLLQKIGKRAEEMGMKAYIVGGFVRDLLLGRPNFDLDVVIEGDGVIFMKSMEADGCKISIHQRFQTGTIVFPDNRRVDIATARREFYEFPVAQPTVASDSLKHDLYRRDFTVNAMAISLSEDNWGVLVDYFGGRRDIRQKKLKMLHNLSFVEDPTRVFRGIRLEQRLHFTLEENTLRLLKSCVRGGFLNLLSGLRVKSELEFILREARPYRAVRRLQALGIWENLFPGLEMGPTALNLMRRLAVFLRRLYRDLPSMEESWLSFLAALVVESPDDFQHSVMDRLNLSPNERKLMESCLFRRGVAENDLGGRGDRAPSEIYTYLGTIHPVAALFWAAATERTRVRRRILLYLTRWHKVEPMLTGQDVLDLGFRPGPLIGSILEGLRNARLDGDIETRDEEIEWIRASFPGNS